MLGPKQSAASRQLSFECEALERRALLTASTLFQITDGGNLPLPDFDEQAYADYLRAFEAGELHHHGHNHGQQGDGLFVEPFALDPFSGGGGCNCPMCQAAARLGSQAGDSAGAGESPVWDSYDLDQTFSLHSLEGADHTIYLDFDGHTTTGTYWNSSFNSNNPIETPAYNFSGNSGSFTDSELARIQRVWARVAEDFAPFNVNVTTEDPGEDALRRSGAGDTEWGVRVVIGANTFYSSAGGVAYVGSFDWSTDTPVFVFNTSELGVSEAASHEVGHALGLRHDGLTTGATYYTGHGSGATSWAPIMGVSYSRSVSQWSQGEYANADRQEDDLQIITTGNGFGYRDDDYGDSLGSATALLTAGDTAFDTTFGIIERNTDTDYFSFVAGAGDATINVDPLAFGANLDILASVYDGTGTLIATSNPTDELNASFDLVLPTEGEYFLSITGTGLGDPEGTGYSDYGSLGNYRVTGTVTRYTVDDNIEIRAAGATNQEQMLLQIDGVTVATFDNVGGDANVGDFETYTFRAPGVTPDQIRIVFTNDDDPVTGSRELRVDSVTIDDVVYQSEHATVFSTGYDPGGGAIAGFNQTEYLHTNGYMQFADPSVSPTGIIIRAAGTTNEEQMLLQVDGVTVATFDNVGGDADAGVFETFTYDVAGVLPQQLRIVFTNDGIGSSGDRDLRVDSVTIDGTTYQTEHPSVFSTGTLSGGSLVFGYQESEYLHVDGYFQFQDPDLTTALTIRASGDEGTEQLEVWIDDFRLDTIAVGTTWNSYHYDAIGEVTADQIRLVFRGDDNRPSAGVDANLHVDWIEVDGARFETDGSDVYSTATWRGSDGLAPGFGRGETLHTEGYFQYSSAASPARQIVDSLEGVRVTRRSITVTLSGDEGPLRIDLANGTLGTDAGTILIPDTIRRIVAKGEGHQDQIFIGGTAGEESSLIKQGLVRVRGDGPTVIGKKFETVHQYGSTGEDSTTLRGRRHPSEQVDSNPQRTRLSSDDFDFTVYEIEDLRQSGIYEPQPAPTESQPGNSGNVAQEKGAQKPGGVAFDNGALVLSYREGSVVSFGESFAGDSRQSWSTPEEDENVSRLV